MSLPWIAASLTVLLAQPCLAQRTRAAAGPPSRSVDRHWDPFQAPGNASESCVTLDFETEDDFITALGNGQRISTPPEFGRLVRISSSGPNAGPAIFDSTPGGPNDPAINDDMLIERGNVLLLQDDWWSFQQTIPGFFDHVTDDPHGGDLIFDFALPVRPRSMLLADINPPPNLGAVVTLIDAQDRVRVYAVEPGWTGTYGNAGPHRLDLTTLEPQPGNGTPRFATAVETSGFQPDAVMRLVLHLTGNGAMDELEFCHPSAFSLQGGWIDVPLDQSALDAWPYVMSLENGEFLVAWTRGHADAHTTVFGSDGSRLQEPRLLQEDEADRAFFSGDVFPDGRFVLAYRYYLAGVEQGTRAQLFRTDHSKEGPEIVVGSGAQLENANVTVLRDGTFVVAYENRSATRTVLNRYSSTGVHLGSHTLPSVVFGAARIAALATGGLVLAFQEGWGGDTLTQTFDNALVQSSETRTDADFSGAAGGELALVAFPAGGFAVVGLAVFDNSVRVLRFRADNTLASDTVIATTTPDAYPSLTAIENGFFVTWEDASFSIHGQQFDAHDLPVARSMVLFRGGAGRTFIADTWGAQHEDTLFVTGYDMQNSDSFVRRLTR